MKQWVLNPGGVRVVRAMELDWQSWMMSDPSGERILVVGTERWPQLVWMTVAPLLLETDSGPLDAKVP